MREVAQHHAVLFAMLGEDSAIPSAIVDAVREAGVPFFRSPERALRALAGLSARAARGAEVAPVTAAYRLPPGVIPEHRAKRTIENAGLPIPARRLVQTAAEVAVAAGAIGYPVALKVQSAALPHKSDIGGVVLALGDAAALADGWRRLHASLAAAAPGVAIDGVLVEQMAPPGLELMVGARTDPE